MKRKAAFFTNMTDEFWGKPILMIDEVYAQGRRQQVGEVTDIHSAFIS